MILGEISEHFFIVIGSEHYNPLGVVRSLGEEGIKPIVIIIRGKSRKRVVSSSKYISRKYFVNDSQEAVDLLITVFGGEKLKPFVFSCDDRTATCLDENYNKLTERFYFFNAGKEGGLRKFFDKKEIGKLAIKHGLNFLEAVYVQNGEIPDCLEYPVITKATNSLVSGWKDEMHICNNEQELKDAFKQINSSVVMIQKYIVKKNEYCLEGFSCNKGNTVFISIQSTYNYTLPMTYSPYMTVNNFDNMNNVFPSLCEMFKEIGFEGIFEVEFLLTDDDKLFFGEINFRNSTWSYASTCAGMNLPILWAESMINNSIDKTIRTEIKKPGFKAMVEFTDFKERVIKRKYSVFRWIHDLFQCKCKYYIGKHDFKPVLTMLSPFKKR